jgi:pyruvate kinase
MKPGLELLLDDGKVRLMVEAHGADYADTVVTAGSELSNRKGLNVPGAILPLPAVTEKDRQDLAFGLTLDIDWVALSFVQRPEDVIEARQLAGDKVKLMVKLEKPSAMDCLDELIALADGVMVARGDLGVELPPEQVPGLQNGSCAPVARRASRWWWPPKCWIRWLATLRPPAPKPLTSRPPFLMGQTR